MRIAQEQKKQFIALCCLVVFVFAFGIYKVVGSGSNAQTRETEAVTKQTDDKSAVPDKPVEAEASPAVVATTDTTGDQAARDPFIPQFSLHKPLETSGSTTVRPPFTPMGTGGRLPGLSPLIPPMPFDRTIKVTTGGGTTTTAVQGREPEQDPSQVYKLTGVIQGSINVAILRGPNNARYIVREGQVIDGKYRVDQVTRFGVRLSFNKRIYLLSLGGSDAVKGAQ